MVLIAVALLAGLLPVMASAAPADGPGRAAAGKEVTLRTFRLALASDPSYARAVGADRVLAEKQELVDTVNRVLSEELAIRLVLIDETEQLDFGSAAEATGPDGPCGPAACYDADTLADGCSSALLEANRSVLGQVVGADRYDIGHLLLGGAPGGEAVLGGVGGPDKAGGCSSSDRPRGDRFALGFLAHELAHQLGAHHTFNGTEGSCTLDERHPATSVEPGSGSSIMGYAGSCGRDDLQAGADAFLAHRSIVEITDRVTDPPAAYAEVQRVALRGFDDRAASVTLRYQEREVTIAHSDYPERLAEQLEELVGEPVVVRGYREGDPPSTDGFTVEFSATTDVPRLEVVGAPAAVGVLVNGGPATSRGTATPTGNHAPSVTAPPDRTVPLRTPFTLSGSGSDVDGDPLSYRWEQDDPGSELVTGGTALLSGARGGGPLFRTVAVGSSDAARTFPDLAQVLAGTTNAATGSCPAVPTDPDVQVAPEVLDCYSELLPTAGYTGPMTFRLTARDLDPAGGGTQDDDTVLTVAPDAGPFLVTSRNTAGIAAAAGGTETVTWDVNGTDAAALAPEVRILLSTDGGRTFPQVLQASTPNDGSADVVWPRVATSTARLRIEAVDNYFFDVSDADFAIGDTAAPETRVSGAGTGSFVLDRKATFTLDADEPDVTFACTFDARAVPCAAGPVALRLGQGQHTFTAVARDPSGNVDPTPAVRTFASPVDDRGLRRVGRGWRALKVRSAYRGTVLQSTRPGQALSTRVTGVRKLALVAPRGPRYGGVRVYAGKRTIAFVDLSSRRLGTTSVIALKTFAKPFTGRVRIVTLGRQPARIDGLGVYRG